MPDQTGSRKGRVVKMKAKIIDQDTDWAVLQCGCGSTTTLSRPLDHQYTCGWCDKINVIDLKTVLLAETANNIC